MLVPRNPNVLARRLLRSAVRPLPSRAEAGWILCYHLVGAGTTSPVDIEESVFGRQVEGLGQTACLVSLADLVERVGASRWTDRPLVALTFDDAYANFAERVLPLLVKRQVPATLYVPVGFVAGESPAPIRGAELPPMSWQQLREAAATNLVTIGSHGWSHCDLRRMNDTALTRELVDSRSLLEDRLGTGVDGFCYPQALWNARVEREAGRCYRTAVVGGGWRLSTANLRPLRLWRVSIRTDTPPDVQDLLRGPVCPEEWVADRLRRRR